MDSENLMRREKSKFLTGLLEGAVELMNPGKTKDIAAVLLLATKLNDALHFDLNDWLKDDEAMCFREDEVTDEDLTTVRKAMEYCLATIKAVTKKEGKDNDER
jgi:hypothetical protein